MNSTTTNTETRILFNGEEYIKATDDCILLITYAAATPPRHRIVCKHIEVRR